MAKLVIDKEMVEIDVESSSTSYSGGATGIKDILTNGGDQIVKIIAALKSAEKVIKEGKK